MITSLKNLIKKLEIPIVLIVLGILFVAYIQGSEWSWNPDEIVKRVNWSLTGNYQFSNDFLYPTLPMYVMAALGKYIYHLGMAVGYSRTLFFTASRWISAFLGIISVGLVYASVRQLHKSMQVGIAALLLAASSHTLAVNAHYAHNDIYQLFFVCLSLFFMIRMLSTAKALWFYLGVFSIGLAASSKYTAGILLPGALLAFLFIEPLWIKRLLNLFLGAFLCYLGYALGTPLSILNPIYYFSQLLPALGFQRSFGQLTATSIGLISQWGLLWQAFNPAALVFYGAAVLGTLGLVYWVWRKRTIDPYYQIRIFCLLSLLCLDLPLAQSYNVQERFFLPMLPFFVVLTVLLLDDVILWLSKHNQKTLGLVLVGLTALVILVSAAYTLSITLIFKYEPRIAAGSYLRSNIVEGKTLEYTLYPPVIPENYFKSSLQYPLFFKKAADWEKTEGSDLGEAGVETRKPDVIVIDSFTYERYDLPEVCQTTPKDCDFFHRLLNGQTSYKLLKTFHLDLPLFLPRVESAFLNPVIKIYERVH